MSLTVVMPTIGRVSIERALQSVLAQTYRPMEILIIDSSKYGIPETELVQSENVKIIRNSLISENNSDQVWTAAHNRNVGVLHAVGSYIAFIDDDDEWLPNKLKIQMESIAGRMDIISSTSVIFRLKSGKEFCRPKKLLNRESNFLRCLYRKPTIFRSRYYLATPTVIVPADIAKRVLFDETLPWYEDTWWFQRLEVMGLRHEQLPDQLAIIYADPKRSIARDSLAKHFIWALRLSSVHKDYGVNYLLGIAIRNSVWLRRWHDLIPIIRNAYKLKKTK